MYMVRYQPVHGRFRLSGGGIGPCAKGAALAGRAPPRRELACVTRDYKLQSAKAVTDIVWLPPRLESMTMPIPVQVVVLLG